MPPLAAVVDGSFDSLMTALHAHYYEKLNFVDIVEEGRYQQALGVEYFYLPTDEAKAAQAFKGLVKKLPSEAVGRLCYAYLADTEERLFDMYQYALLGFKVGAEVMRYEQLDYVLRVHKLSKRVGGEAHLLKGFTRFAEAEGGLFYAEISPKNNVLTILAEHFTDRLMNQNWLIHDVKRRLAAVYDTKKYQIVETPGKAFVNITEEEQGYGGLWQSFHKSIAVEQRMNYRQQRQMLPLYFRKNMLEFKAATIVPKEEADGRDSTFLR